LNRKNTHSFQTVFILLIFCLFAVCSLFLVLIGANVYRGIVRDMNANNETRSSLSYVSNKVRTADPKDVSVEKVEDRTVLVIRSSYNHSEYKTYIYLNDGYLMEFFSKAENPFTLGDGDKITPVSSFSIEKKDNQLNLSVSDGDKPTLSLELFLS
jgi:hypothetical protein